MTSLLRPTFAFVIPAYNEADDIVDTLEAVWAQRYPAQEVIVVNDGSTDETPSILRSLRNSRAEMILIEHDKNRGLSAARNTGLRAASADVVVFLDADDQPAPDFLERLAPHYQQGFDCISVESRVPGDVAVTRYTQADHEVQFSEHPEIVGWTAGFSCRRDAALAVFFPEELPHCGLSEDGEFFPRLMDKGYTHAVDFSIVVARRVPRNVRGFWRQWVVRGRPVAYLDWFVKRRRMAVVVGRRTLVTARTLVLMLAVVPSAVAVFRRSRKSRRQLRDFPAFWVLYHLQQFALRIGEWRGVFEVMRDGSGSASPGAPSET